ncbi:MAG: tetratricopeptide repeat protein [Vicingaceae bacterium]|nr:tetratricopeptide repeat protein [Vicingaceae bacterium]
MILLVSISSSFCTNTSPIIFPKKIEFSSKEDSLKLNKILPHYYNPSSSLLIKLKSISLITDHLNNPKTWKPYNDWLIDTCEYILANNPLTKVEKYGVLKILGIAYNNLGYLHNINGSVDAALNSFNKSLKIHTQINNLKGMSQSLNNIGYIYGDRGFKELEAEYYLKSLKLREQIDDKYGIANSLNNIGYLYKNEKEYDKAQSYYKRSLEISYELEDLNSAAATLNNISYIYLQLENFKKARTLLNESCKIREQTGNKFGIAQCYESIGLILENQSIIDSAEFYYQKSLEIREGINDKKGIAICLNKLGKLHYNNSDLKLSSSYLIQSLEKSKEIKHIPLMLSNAKLLSKIYEYEKKYSQSLNMLSFYVNLNDSVNTISHKLELEKQTENTKLKYENDVYKLKTETKNQLIQKSKDDLLITLVILIISFIVFLTLIHFLRMKIKTIRKQKEQIAKVKDQLNELNYEQKRLLEIQDTLLKEIHHRVKNNLQVITSLLALQSSFIKDNDIKRVFRYAQYRINSMAMVHEMLYQTEDLSKINIKAYVNRLSRNLVHSMCGSKNNVLLSIDITSDLYLNIDTVIPLGLLINEILTNSIKYGINKSKGKIYITIEHLSKDNYLMRIGDDGNGFDDESLFRASNSLGLILIHNLTIQLKGSIEKDNKLTGTNYIITFKENLSTLKNYEENINS